MAKCYFEESNNTWDIFWGKWICTNINVEGKMIKFCRKAFKDRYKDYWVYPIYFDDKYFRYTTEFFSEVGVALYPKRTKSPKKHKGNTGKYSQLLYDTAMEDIAKANDENAIYVIVKGVRYKNENSMSTYIERITSIEEVNSL